MSSFITVPRVWNGLPLNVSAALHSLYRPSKNTWRHIYSDSHL